MPRTGVDYATDQITVYRYCRYGCVYCWAWRVPLFSGRISRGRYDPVEEARRYAGRTGRVIVVSFTSDPYPPEEEYRRLTRRVLEVLVKSSNKVLVLTKNPLLALRDIDLMGNGSIWLGTTVVTIDDNVASQLEPNAPKPSSRLEALRQAKQYGVKTWLSLEPIIPCISFPEDVIKASIDYVDWYVLGAFNYYRSIRIPRVNRYIPFNGRFSKQMLSLWYNYYIPRAIELLKKHGKPFFIKKELKRYLDV